jgi:hypothetical protein
MATVISTTQFDLTNTTPVMVDITASDNFSVQVSGTFSGTWAVTVSMDNVVYQPLAVRLLGSITVTETTSISNAGIYVKSCAGLKYIKVQFFSYTSGTANVTVVETILDK